MVEATTTATNAAAASDPPQPQHPALPLTEIGMCEHDDSLATYCKIHD